MPDGAGKTAGHKTLPHDPTPSPPAETSPLILACSPRRGGNSDHAASLLREAIPHARLVHLRDFAVSPCLSCGRCAVSGTPCPLMQTDDSAPLFAALAKAATLFIVSPIYFYHLPAQFKALIDRSQFLWMNTEHAAASLPDETMAHARNTRQNRKAGAVLIGARTAGNHLFTGSILTLRYWLRVFDYTLADPLTLYGLDHPEELARHAEGAERIRHYASGLCSRKTCPSGSGRS